MGQKSTRQKARETNVRSFGHVTNDSPTELIKQKNLIPKHKTEFKNVIAYLDKVIGDEDGKRAFPANISASHAKIFRELLAIATRENLEDISEVKCPVCKQSHYIKCENEKCGLYHDILVPSAALEKNKMLALTKLADKFAPNLAAVSVDVDVNIVITKISSAVMLMINDFVPGDKRIECMTKVNALIGEAVNG